MRRPKPCLSCLQGELCRPVWGGLRASCYRKGFLGAAPKAPAVHGSAPETPLQVQPLVGGTHEGALLSNIHRRCRVPARPPPGLRAFASPTAAWAIELLGWRLASAAVGWRIIADCSCAACVRACCMHIEAAMGGQQLGAGNSRLQPPIVCLL